MGLTLRRVKLTGQQREAANQGLHRLQSGKLPCRQPGRPSPTRHWVRTLPDAPSPSVGVGWWKPRSTQMPRMRTSRLSLATTGALAFCLQSPLPVTAHASIDRLLVYHLVTNDPSAPILVASRSQTARQQRMRTCLNSWGPATQMSKREWRSTCRRVIIQYPGTFGPDPL